MLMLPSISYFGGGAAAPSSPPQYIANGAWTNQTSSPINVAYPAGLQANDIAILAVSAFDASASSMTIPAPSGWTELGTVTMGSTQRRHSVFWKRLDGSESGSVSVAPSPALSSTDSCSGRMTIYRGCKATGDPFEGVATNNLDDHPAVTTTGTDRTIVTCFSIYFGTIGSNVTPHASFTERYDQSSGVGQDCGQALADKQAATAGTYGPDAATSDGIHESAIGFALIPA